MNIPSIHPPLRHRPPYSLSRNTTGLDRRFSSISIRIEDLVHRLAELGFAQEEQPMTAAEARDAIVGGFCTYVREVDAFSEGVSTDWGFRRRDA